MTCVVSVPPNLTVVEAVEFERQVKAYCKQQPSPQTIVIDLSDTTFMDSSGLGALMISYRACQQQHIAIVLRGVREQVRMVLTMTDLDQLFTLEPGTNEADVASPEVKFAEITTHPSVHSKGKRAMDIVGALVGLGITAILAIPIIIAIKLEDGGPIFFKQVRCSWLGKRFYIWKFRSMVTDAEALKAKVKNEVEGPLFKNENDPRITKVGRFLRRTSLDELPQFWNVLRGEMSLVGTRPPTPDEIEQYKVPEWQRLDVKPGMTGEWQVNGRSSVKKFEDVIRMDLDYQKNWSLMYDVKLILKTILVLFSKKAGAA
ncbi:anti-sigma factor antagonist [Phormidium sp. FACHB-1136]|uniref:anti-sigma factor antagonist n=1 Tax=Phormidium sp. FACHB-1136 TaxID=2692848 RepID=UPI001F558467|nr:anti-sigma factor antagonist [Phormidium sp. FACHB-1136]